MWYAMERYQKVSCMNGPILSHLKLSAYLVGRLIIGPVRAECMLKIA
jgi:hypothetical protein